MQPLLKFSVSHDPSETIIICWYVLNKHLLLKLKMVVLLTIFGNSDVFVSAFYDEYIILHKKNYWYVCVYIQLKSKVYM